MDNSERPPLAGTCCGLLKRAPLPAIILLAILLRVYRLGEQSLWFDDFIAFGPLRAPDLQTYLSVFRAQFPEHGATPLYYSLQYFASRLIGMSPPLMRLLPITFGVLTVLLSYGFVRYLLSPTIGERKARNVGLITSLCLALSPQHIWYSQELRCYGLVSLLVLMSLWSFMRGYRERRFVWWTVNIIVNALMPLTHLLTVVIIFLEGLFLLAFSLRRLTRVIGWSAIQLLFLAPATLAVMGMAFSNHFHAFGASWDRAFDFIFRNDIVSIHAEILPAWKNRGASFATFPRLISLCPWFDPALFRVSIAAALWGGVCLLRSLWQWRSNAVAKVAVENMTILLLLLCLPGLAAGLIAAILVTMIFPAYTMFSYVALYALTGMLVLSLPGKWLRRAAVVAVFGLYAFQALVLVPEVTRADWRSAAAHIRAHASPEDTVIDVEHLYVDRELAFYLAPEWSIHYVQTIQAACDDAARILDAEGQMPEAKRRRVWIALQPMFLKWITGMSFDPVSAFAAAFRQRHLAYSITEFPGHNEVLLCSVWRGSDAVCGIGSPVRQLEPLPAVFAGAMLHPIDYDAVLDELGFKDREATERAALRIALRESIDHWPIDERYPGSSRLSCVWPILDLTARGRTELAKAVARNLLAVHPGFGLLHMALGAAYLREHKLPEALAELDMAGKLHEDLRIVLAPFVDALDHDPSRMLEEALKLEHYGFWFAPALRRVCSEASVP